MAGQDNITHDRTCPGRMYGGDRTCTHTHTHNTNGPTLLLRDIQLINTECTPCKHRTNAKLTQNLRSGDAGPPKSGHRTKTLSTFNRP